MLMHSRLWNLSKTNKKKREGGGKKKKRMTTPSESKARRGESVKTLENS